MGYLMAMAGICLISLPQGNGLSLHPAGDLLAITSVLVLHEHITKTAFAGILLTLAGLFWLQNKEE